jgi:hypothetical protein
MVGSVGFFMLLEVKKKKGTTCWDDDGNTNTS